jgi:hypothetical protein
MMGYYANPTYKLNLKAFECVQYGDGRAMEEIIANGLKD